MRKTVIDGATQKTLEILKTDDPQLLVLENVSVNAKLKTELIRQEGGSDQRLFNTMNVLLTLEGQNKIQAFLNKQAIKQFQLKTVPNGDAGTNVVIDTAAIDLAYGGEIMLNQNDSVNNYLTNLEKTSTSSIYSFGGQNVSPFPYIMKEQTFKATETQKEINLIETDFLVFDKDNLPTDIDFRINGQKQKRTSETLLIDQKDIFNIVGFDENDKPIFGTAKAVVLDVRGMQSVYLEQNTDPRSDIKYYSVKTPFKKVK
ncbi:hypothetical protein [Tenacibaculum discolor]|uniref:hypothetical protein n=1 Tax=Tenacibaculum discolor TaxID=361581 RepID=UPI000EAF6160|nr:hypothetical protein [Tenacibaculum discolor]RLK02364.1 hypothetical protein C8N27_1499 [Tenacibaculum discolor]